MPVGSISVFFGEVLYSCFWLEASRPPSHCCTALLPYDCGGKISYEDATVLYTHRVRSFPLSRPGRHELRLQSHHLAHRIAHG